MMLIDIEMLTNHSASSSTTINASWRSWFLLAAFRGCSGYIVPRLFRGRCAGSLESSAQMLISGSRFMAPWMLEDEAFSRINQFLMVIVPSDGHGSPRFLICLSLFFGDKPKNRRKLIISQVQAKHCANTGHGSSCWESSVTCGRATFQLSFSWHDCDLDASCSILTGIETWWFLKMRPSHHPVLMDDF